MTLPTEVVREPEIHSDTRMTSSADLDAEWDEEIRLRVEQIRNGTAGPDLLEVMAELDRCEAEHGDEFLDDVEDESGDPAEIEAAWADEIAERVRELREGTVKTYAAEDVMAVLRSRFG
jgi:hypothetical protein